MSLHEPAITGLTLSLMPTFQCTAACAHCGTLSSPQERTHLGEEPLSRAIDEAAEIGFGVVVFTGGEPTLAGPKLLRLMSRAKAHQMVTRMVTNAHWATTADVARRQLARYAEAGLDEINFSTGDEHARFVPLERVLHATRAAVERQMPVSIMIENQRERSVTQATIEGHPLFLEICAATPDHPIRLNESPWMPLTPDPLIAYGDGQTCHAGNVAFARGCDSVLTTTTVEANGTIRACCGLGMRLIPELEVGHIDQTGLSGARANADNDFLKRWIRIEGPERILAWAARIDPAIEWEHQYAHRCQACIRLYSDPAVRDVIRTHYEEKIADVVIGEWLLYHHRENAAATT